MGSVGYVKADKEDISDYKYESGDLIFSNINSEEHIGKTAIFDIEEDLYHGMNTLRIRTNLVNRYYLYYVFSSDIQKKVWRRISQPAVNQVSINQSILKNVNIPVPPLWEQERIASVFYTVDEMISNVEDKIECLEELKQGLMQDLLTGNKRTPQNLQKLEQITQH